MCLEIRWAGVTEFGFAAVPPLHSGGSPPKNCLWLGIIDDIALQVVVGPGRLGGRCRITRSFD